MTQPFVDTDVIIRLLTGDDLKSKQQQQRFLSKSNKDYLPLPRQIPL